MMRSRPIALASAALALSFFAAACGSDEPDAAGVATTPAAATTPAGTPADPQAPSSKNPKATGPGITRPPESSSKATVMAQIKANAELKTLSTMLTVAGLSQTLSRPGPYTVFAPNNDAFTKLGSELSTLLEPANAPKLADLLKFQIVSGRLRSEDLKSGKLLTTLQGGKLRVSVNGDTITLKNRQGSTTILSPDQRASNGVIHVTSTVLKPRK